VNPEKGMRIAALDFGEKRIGVAVSDPLQITAQGIGTIAKAATFNQDIAALKDLLSNYSGITEIIVGMPKTLSGKTGPAAERVQAFIAALKAGFSLKITAWDERLTTKEAEQSLLSLGMSREKRKKVIDQTAAAIMLQGYLGTRKK
jgi:putative Holliday junction resolvase